MTLKDFGITLSNMYQNAPEGKKVLMIHLFGIKYAKEIKESDYKVSDILKQAEIRISHDINIRAGIHLADYVIIKDDTNL